MSAQGEVSLSVEETNKLRASMGMKPLKGETETKEIREGDAKNPVSYMEKEAEAEARKKAEKQEHRKKLYEESNALKPDKDVYKDGPTMTEALAGETDDAAEWANQHRWKKMRTAAKAKRLQERHGAEETEGLHVAHDFDKFQEGEDVTLVMADTPLLNEKGELNLEKGELENVNWKDGRKVERNNEIKNDPARHGYNASLEDTYEIGAGGMPVKRLLAQYDEKPIGEKGFTLGQRQKELQAMDPEERLNALTKEASSSSASRGIALSQAMKFQSDYYRPGEVGFRKPKIKKMKKRKQLKEDDEPKGVVSFKTLERPEDCDSDEEDPELYESLRKQRKLWNTESDVIRPTKESTKELLDKVKEKMEEGDDEGERGMTITDTTQFCKSVETAVEKVESLKSETYNGTNMYKAQVQAKRKQMRGVKVKGGKKDKKKQKEVVSAEVKAAIEQDSDEDEAGMAETPLDMTVGSALEYLRSRDQIGNDQDTCRKRNKDHRPLETSTGDGDIKLEYRDKFGRVQNAKEAFRTISWKFHGKMPGHKNYERRLQRYEREMVLRKKADQDLPTQRALEAVQRIEHKPHMVLGAEK